MCSFLMWSNLVFSLAHLNILISAEFSLPSSFFFTSHHSEPYVIAGLMILFEDFVFQCHGNLPITHYPGYFGKYSVFAPLIFNPCLLNTTLHVSRSSSTSRTRSSANIIAKGGSFRMFSVRTSERGLRADHRCNPTSIGKYSV